MDVLLLCFKDPDRDGPFVAREYLINVVTGVEYSCLRIFFDDIDEVVECICGNCTTEELYHKASMKIVEHFINNMDI